MPVAYTSLSVLRAEGSPNDQIILGCAGIVLFPIQFYIVTCSSSGFRIIAILLGFRHRAGKRSVGGTSHTLNPGPSAENISFAGVVLFVGI